MNHRFAPTALLLALAAFATCAPAQTLLQTETFDEPGQVASQGQEAEAPGRVGRISLVEGKVDLSGDIGAESSAAQVNWPITSRNMVSTARGARTEIRIGSTAIRLDGDSALEVTELDDDRMRLRLHYGSASIRVMNPELLADFELRTAQATVRLNQPGRLRVDADRTPDTTLVSMLDGEAQVDGGGANLTLRAGRSAEVRDDDVRTQQARRDVFDDWSLTRDQQLAEAATRYVGTEMTGYEELDRHGSWSTHSDYGTLWTPAVAVDWTPYRDGSWTWIAPWGWTWVDNAPWGYAPFHYGRWVQVRNRWSWAPGRFERRPVWSPALVGWVGGNGWSASFGGHARPAHGWYPLTPYDRFEPRYRLSNERLRRLNDWRQARAHAQLRDRERDRRRDGLTVLPHDAFGGHGRVNVPNAPRGVLAPNAPPRFNAGAGAPPPPNVARPGWNDERRQRFEHRVLETRRNDGERLQRDRWEQDRRAGERMQQERQWRERADQERVQREQASAERLARERGDQQERIARQQEERERLQSEYENRIRQDRVRDQLERNQRDRLQRERLGHESMMRDQAERQRRPAVNTSAPPVFEHRPERSAPPASLAAPPPRPSAPAQMAAPPPNRSSPPPFTPSPRAMERRSGSDGSGIVNAER